MILINSMFPILVCLALALCAFARETQHDAAQQLRGILSDHTNHYIGTLAAVAPNATHAAVGAEYYAPCLADDHPGDLLMLALPVSAVWRNVLDKPVTASLMVTSSADERDVDLRHSVREPSGREVWEPERPMWRRGFASKGRAALYGSVHRFNASDSQTRCFVRHHPDAGAWTPGAPESPHTAVWVRFHPESIYYVGGFGDEHYIGMIDQNVYEAAWKPPALVVQH
ncbi:hypothetical protein MCUN1_001485 [Malassezia cuniculi]|uniref:CREG-like beta-barrel domain-containing protein n=1 Tax=Malassezia cuniculi TaxID=948313 RepID=A0AAF0ET51_9BASI|nr:hypothetical protein MCUN1_001485 [Malassezia cuniculi]